jgi:hypothetical protein
LLEGFRVGISLGASPVATGRQVQHPAENAVWGVNERLGLFLEAAIDIIVDSNGGAH